MLRSYLTTIARFNYVLSDDTSLGCTRSHSHAERIWARLRFQNSSRPHIPYWMLMVHDSSYHFESRTAKCIANPDRPAMTMDSGLDPTPLQPKLYHVYSRRHWFEQLISLVTIDLKEQFTFIGSLYKNSSNPSISIKQS
jgi:hypothetical protein